MFWILVMIDCSGFVCTPYLDYPYFNVDSCKTRSTQISLEKRKEGIIVKPTCVSSKTVIKR